MRSLLEGDDDEMSSKYVYRSEYEVTTKDK